MKLTKNVILTRKGFQPLPQKLLLKDAHVVDPGQKIDRKADILIENNEIKAIGAVNESSFDGDVINLNGMVVSPGWLDMHVHLREPGREDEETIETGSLAAANGGFTAVCCMPNTKPPIDTQEIIQYIKDRAQRALVQIYPIAAITKKREGKELAEILELVEQGAVAISDDGSPVMNAELMRRALEYSKMIGIPVIGHEEDLSMTDGGQINEGYVSTCLGLGGIPSVAEDILVARDIMLSEYTGGRFHVAHISSQKSVELVRHAKARGIRVSAEVTPHHFTLSDDAVRGYDTNTKMSPPLRTEEDRLALIEGLKDGTIDVIATDHAPHSLEEKEAEYILAPFGIVGLETAAGLALTQLFHKGVLDLFSLIEKFALNPYKILNLKIPAIREGETPNLTVLDPDVEWEVDVKKFLSKCVNSPFIGWKMKGKPFAVINKGQIFLSTL